MKMHDAFERKYLLIGSGRLARHLKHYLTSLEVPLTVWSRDSDQPLSIAAEGCDVVMLAISDPALPEWILREELEGKCLVHFAGSKFFPTAWGFHPLMTFADRLYSQEFYGQIPFVADPGFRYREIFPFLSNPVFELPPEKRVLYHALCHMAANFPALLWSHVFTEFEKDLKLPRQILAPILRQILDNTILDGEQALAGPLKRGDLQTLSMHEDALAKNASLASIYRLWTDWALSFPNIAKPMPQLENLL